MKYKYAISNYTEDKFNKKDEEYEQLVDKLKDLVEDAENQSIVIIDGVKYPTSMLWRDIATTALDLANYADWFDRYDQKNNSRKD